MMILAINFYKAAHILKSQHLFRVNVEGRVGGYTISKWYKIIKENSNTKELRCDNLSQ